MTSGERMVWAAEFVRALSQRPTNVRASMVSAYSAVDYLRNGAAAFLPLDPDGPRAMLEDMLSNGGDR